VNLSAHICKPSGMFNNLVSLVTEPTTATILELNFFFPWSAALLAVESILTSLETEIGYLLSLDWLRRLKTVELNLD
jgi:hypothetical protein